GAMKQPVEQCACGAFSLSGLLGLLKLPQDLRLSGNERIKTRGDAEHMIDSVPFLQPVDRRGEETPLHSRVTLEHFVDMAIELAIRTMLCRKNDLDAVARAYDAALVDLRGGHETFDQLGISRRVDREAFANL